MRTLPLYDKLPQCAAAAEKPLEVDHECDRCELSRKTNNVCVRPEASAQDVRGGVLLVGDFLTREDSDAGRPFYSSIGQYVRRVVRETYSGPIVLTNALSCALSAKPDEKYVDACRGYVSRVIRKMRPSRIVALGSWAAYSLLGRKVSAFQIRQSYGWYIDEDAWPSREAWRPVFVVQNPGQCIDNKFLSRWFNTDLKNALTATPTPPFVTDFNAPLDWSVFTHLVKTADDAREALDELIEVGAGTYDVEASGQRYGGDYRIESLTIVARGSKSLFTWDNSYTETAAWKVLRVVFNSSIEWTGHNTQYDALAVMIDKRIASPMPNVAGDTRLFRKLRDGDVPASLSLTSEAVGMGGHKDEADSIVDSITTDLVKLAAEPHRPPTKTGKPRKPYVPSVVQIDSDVDMPKVLDAVYSGAADPREYAYRYLDPAVRVRYNARDTFATEVLRAENEPALRADEALRNVWDGVLRDAVKAVARMTEKGVYIDRGANRAYSMWLETQLDEVRKRILPYFPGSNPSDAESIMNSPPKLGELLFDRLRLQVPTQRGKRAGKERSTDKTALELLEGMHPIIDDIGKWRALKYQQSHYADGMLPFIKPDGRVHTSFLILGADTGRMSSSDPNLFNITSPERDTWMAKEFGTMARAQFTVPDRCAKHGCRLMMTECDQSQIELREAARISRDKAMIELFCSGMDFHLGTARKTARVRHGLSPEAFDALPKEKQKQQRGENKKVNFGLLYGKTVPALARDLGCTVKVAQSIYDAILGEFMSLAAWIKEQHRFGLENGGVYVPFRGAPSNWRWLTALGNRKTDHFDAALQNALNSCINTPIQGSAAHLTTQALWKMQDAFDAEGLCANVILTVYDSAMAEHHEEDQHEVREIMKWAMTDYPDFGVPKVVDFKHGRAWGALKGD